MEVTSENQNSELMIGQPPWPLVPKGESGGVVFIWGNVVSRPLAGIRRNPYWRRLGRHTEYLKSQSTKFLYAMHLSSCCEQLTFQKPATQRPIWSCDFRSKINPGSLEFYLPCQVAWVSDNAMPALNTAVEDPQAIPQGEDSALWDGAGWHRGCIA